MTLFYPSELFLVIKASVSSTSRIYCSNFSQLIFEIFPVNLDIESGNLISEKFGIYSSDICDLN